jgi:hypothetical protein
VKANVKGSSVTTPSTKKAEELYYGQSAIWNEVWLIAAVILPIGVITRRYAFTGDYSLYWP